MSTEGIKSFIEKEWYYQEGKEITGQGPIVADLMEFITYKNDSPDFDPGWYDNGKMHKAALFLANSINQLCDRWKEQGCDTKDISLSLINMKEGQKPDGPLPAIGDLPPDPPKGPKDNPYTPLLLLEIKPFKEQTHDGTVLLYGHMDKQPGLEREKWHAESGPYEPLIKNDKLYGRGGADDGYAIFSAFSAIMALRQNGVPHARCVIMIEACEESGSTGLDKYLEHYKQWLKNVNLIVCLDSGCEDWDKLWLTKSLRGLVNGVLRVDTIKDGVHSGDASGIVPSSFRILNQLIARLEDPVKGEITLDGLKVDISPDIRQQAKETADELGEGVYTKYNFLPGVQPVTDQLDELVLNRTWRAQLSVTGMDELPPTADAGNVMLPKTIAKLSFRLPPTLDSGQAAQIITDTLESSPPYSAKVKFDLDSNGNGWAAPTLAEWLKNSLDKASDIFFVNKGKGFLSMGEGGSIPFMGLLGQIFPQAQFVITGVLGPQSNAHGPNEFLHLPMAQKVSMCVAQCLADHCQNGLPATLAANAANAPIKRGNWGKNRCCGHSHTGGTGGCSI